MQDEQALVVCAFGWGKEFRLYREMLYVGSRGYRLTGLTQVQLKTQQTLGVASASLDLRFGRETVALRGIAAVDDARRVAEYLVSWCGEGQKTGPRLSSRGETAPLKQAELTQRTWQPLPSPIPQTLTLHEQVTRPVDTPQLLSFGKDPQTGPKHNWKQERKTERLAQAEVLPVINVPVRLESGEQAYYCSRATRCGELIKETLRSTYPAQDHGLLILTDRRLLFIGRKSQLVLEYAHLLRISRLEGALSFETDHWQKRAIFTTPQPDLCIARLEAILQTRAAARQPGTGPVTPRVAAYAPGVAQRAERVKTM
ncbi:MAG TPA: hypothetical protein VGT44_05480 [Ktedonobacteraceae bacterium]|nr:hypothetical protein [Ktedonobacteraceae bacterium]